jgi:hypothetical protein
VGGIEVLDVADDEKKEGGGDSSRNGVAEGLHNRHVEEGNEERGGKSCHWRRGWRIGDVCLSDI